MIGTVLIWKDGKVVNCDLPVGHMTCNFCESTMHNGITFRSHGLSVCRKCLKTFCEHFLHVEDKDP